MSVRIMSAVWAIDLPDSEKLVLLALADCANDEGHCWPSMASLAKKCSKGERTVQGAIQSLVKAGHLSREEVPGRGCNYYVHPRSKCTPAKSAPPQRTTSTPAAAADKPSRTITSEAKASSERVGAAWNSMAAKHGLPKVSGIFGKRERSLKARIAEHGEEAVLRAISSVPNSPHWLGANGWLGNFDSLMRPDNFQRMLEGAYATKRAANCGDNSFLASLTGRAA